ncbi:InlB B-repeat-containing protein [Butyrivibrio sp. FCS014]|uniref:InlB B-repeat-containing protein n=3 Tax=Butyrivibrio sp. FCS014 TaxID=1408304 RepID=UPI000466EC1B|nr:hypothetical protein [Butyrivibrio sp. FCS014]
MKESLQNVFIRICAVLLIACVVVSSITAVQIIRVYAEEGGDYPENTIEETVPEPVTEQEVTEPEPERQQEEQSDPFDNYDLTCYTPNVDFGSVYQGTSISDKQIGIVNIGLTTIPLTWEEFDESTAFDVALVKGERDLEPGATTTFSIKPNTNLPAGKYTAKYQFFSLNDYRRHHRAEVLVTMTIKANEPYVSSVDITPGSVSLPTGKSYKFQAAVSGGNGYNEAVVWSIAGQQSTGTTINGDGLLQISSDETSGSFAVIATSVQDSSVTDSAIVTISAVDHYVYVGANPSEGGAVAGGGAVKDGGSCTISASPNNNFNFEGWYEGKALISNARQVTISNIKEDRNIEAVFSRNTCYVRTSVNIGDGGTITDSASVPYGGKITLTAKAKANYSFEGFVENGKTISKASSLELNNITSDRNIQAVFSRDKCNVNVSVYPQDTGKYEGAGTYNKGTKVELRAQAYDGYEFTGWTINSQVVSRDAKYTINEIKSDINVVANFKKKNATTYKLVSGITNAGGSIIPSGDYLVPEGASLTYNMVPQADYNISAVIIDGKNIGAVSSYTFNNIRGGHTITVSFEKKPAPAPQPSSKNSQTAKSATTKKAEPVQKTEYNEKTAAEGAVPEQQIIDAEVPKQDSLEGEEYDEDVYTPADESPTTDGTIVTTGVMAKHNLDEETVKRLIRDDAVYPMLREAFEDGTLQITINNSYAENPQETSEELYYSKPTLLNFERVVAETLSDDEKFAVLTGTPISFNVDISENSEYVDTSIKSAMQKKVGYKAITYFDFLIMKTSDGTSSIINNTAAELEVMIPIPEEYQKAGRKFCVLRYHNGSVDILDDIGTDDPTTITFKTDKFSEYAIAYEAININKLIIRFAIITFIALVLAVICFAALVSYRRSLRKQRRLSK